MSDKIAVFKLTGVKKSNLRILAKGKRKWIVGFVAYKLDDSRAYACAYAGVTEDDLTFLIQNDMDVKFDVSFESAHQPRALLIPTFVQEAFAEAVPMERFIGIDAMKTTFHPADRESAAKSLDSLSDRISALLDLLPCPE